ncbi:MAG: sigma 54-interacting transcriptional regulator [Lautropia sp.]
MTETDPRIAAIGSRHWLETHAEPFVLIDADYTIVAANRAYARAYGTSPEAIVGRKCHQVSHRSEEPCHHHGENCPHRTVFAAGEPTQVVHVHYDAHGNAERVRLTARPLPLADGGLLMSESVEQLQPLEPADAALMIGATPAYERLTARLLDAAASDLPLLLTGETGVGKEVSARFVHAQSPRSRAPLVVIDCTAIPEALFESELFGHEKGAFTGPSARRIGLAEEADGGTLFFDEIGELPGAIQAKLLRFIETGEYRRLGSNQTRRVDCRVIAATNRPLEDAAAVPGFRRDLYYRLAGIEVRVPPLRERRADVPRIAAVLLHEHQRRTGCPGLSDAAQQALQAYDYPGNIRELRHRVLRAAQRAGAARIEVTHLALDPPPAAAPASIPGGRDAEAREPDADALAAAGAGAADSADAGSVATGRGGASLAERIAALCDRGLSRRAVAARLAISERTVYRHLARRDAG